MQTYTRTKLLLISQPQTCFQYQLIPRVRMTTSSVHHACWHSECSCCCSSHTLHNQRCHASTRLIRTAATSASPQQTAPKAATSKQSRSDSSSWQQVLLDNLDPQQLFKITLKAKITAKPDQLIAHVRNKGSESSSSSSASIGNERSDPNAAAAAAVAAGVMPYKQLTVRPVMLKGNMLLQFSLLDSRQDITKNYSPQQAAEQLQQLLRLPWHSATLQTHTSTTTIQVTKKGKALVQTTPAAINTATSSRSSSSEAVLQQQQQQQRTGGLAPVSPTAGVVFLQHDRVKALPINGSVADPFLQRIGLQTADGRIKASMQAKFAQINEFLKLLIHTGELEHMGQQQQQRRTTANADSSSSSSSEAANSSSSSGGGGGEHTNSSSEPAGNSSSVSSEANSSSSGGNLVHILDCGCGSSHLTFGTYHYLSNVRGLPLQLTGIDTNKALMERSNTYCTELGIEQHAQFLTAAIRDYVPQQAPDIVLALHACDTATDESLALGIRAGARVIMAVPCCQKDLHKQYHQQQQQLYKQKGPRAGSSSSGSSAELFAPLLSHGILRQRVLDLLTDTFRAHLLQLCSYKTDVVEFVSTEHTPRNLLIRAVRQQRQLPEADMSRFALEYVQLKQYWGVTPHLEKLLRADGLLPAALLQLDD